MSDTKYEHRITTYREIVITVVMERVAITNGDEEIVAYADVSDDITDSEDVDSRYATQAEIEEFEQWLKNPETDEYLYKPEVE